MYVAVATTSLLGSYLCSHRISLHVIGSFNIVMEILEIADNTTLFHLLLLLEKKFHNLTWSWTLALIMVWHLWRTIRRTCLSISKHVSTLHVSFHFFVTWNLPLYLLHHFPSLDVSFNHKITILVFHVSGAIMKNDIEHQSPNDIFIDFLIFYCGGFNLLIDSIIGNSWFLFEKYRSNLDLSVLFYKFYCQLFDYDPH